MLAAVTCSAQPANARVFKALRQAEARRSARVKTLGARLVKTLKHADLEAREAFVEELRDLTGVVSDALLPPPPPPPAPEDPAPQAQ